MLQLQFHPPIPRAYQSLSPKAIPNDKVAVGPIMYHDDPNSLDLLPDRGLGRPFDVCPHFFDAADLANLGLPQVGGSYHEKNAILG